MLARIVCFQTKNAKHSGTCQGRLLNESPRFPKENKCCSLIISWLGKTL